MSQATRELLHRAAPTDAAPVLGAERAARRGLRLRQWRRAQIALPVVLAAVLALAFAGRVLHVGDASRIAPAGPGGVGVREPRQEERDRTRPGGTKEGSAPTTGSISVPGVNDSGPAVDASAGTAPGAPRRGPVAANPGASGSGRLVFVSKRDGNAEIYAMDPDGRNLRRLTESAFDEQWPAWSPDGSRIAFVSNRSGRYEIYTMRSDGSGVRRVGGVPGEHASSVAWSPDGKRFAFVSSPRAAPHVDWHAVWIMNTDASGQRRVTDDGNELSPVWSPDGERIAYWTPGAVPTVHVAILESEISVLLGNGAWPAWSPDGRRIAFVDMKSGSDRQTLRTMDPDGTAVRNVLTTDDGWLGHPSWSPAGDVIAFDRDPDGHMFCAADWGGLWTDPVSPCTSQNGPRASTLWLIRPDGTGLRRLSGSSADDHNATFTR